MTDKTEITLRSVLNDLGLSISALARALEMSMGSAARLADEGRWPRALHAKDPRPRALGVWLIQNNAKHSHLHALYARAVIDLDEVFMRNEATEARRAARNQKAAEAAIANPQEELMLLEFTPVTAAAKQHFKLPRNPFVDDINSREDVFHSPSLRLVRASMLDAAQTHGFVAVLGESGSGKSTLREELEERIREEDRPITVIKPYVLGMEPDDVRGKRMKVGAIAEAIARELAPSVTLKSSPEARFAQVEGLLRDSCRAGQRHLLVIEEAHRMPVATLRHLKAWMELKDGLRRLIGVCLIGQPELGELLREHRADIREIVQRCEKVWLHPLDKDLEAYLAHKFTRIGVPVADVIAADAYDAMRARLVHRPRGGAPDDVRSICYPLVVNNLTSRALNAAARAGWAKVDAQVVAGC